MFKSYRKSQEAQLNWIRQHPVLYIILNVIGLIGVWGYIEYQDRQLTRAIENTRAQHNI